MQFCTAYSEACHLAWLQPTPGSTSASNRCTLEHVSTPSWMQPSAGAQRVPTQPCRPSTQAPTSGAPTASRKRKLDDVSRPSWMEPSAGAERVPPSWMRPSAAAPTPGVPKARRSRVQRPSIYSEVSSSTSQPRVRDFMQTIREREEYICQRQIVFLGPICFEAISSDLVFEGLLRATPAIFSVLLRSILLSELIVAALCTNEY